MPTTRRTLGWLAECLASLTTERGVFAGSGGRVKGMGGGSDGSSGVGVGVGGGVRRIHKEGDPSLPHSRCRRRLKPAVTDDDDEEEEVKEVEVEEE
ncbi:hypothetical protein M0804_008242 [Polistes exclamans]|nr:hypothetical protein M0804_008242 [Polistes exclamans]